jgi:hypothetical protein
VYNTEQTVPLTLPKRIIEEALKKAPGGDTIVLEGKALNALSSLKYWVLLLKKKTFT